MNLVHPDKWLTIDELAKYLKLGRTKLYRMAQEGGIPVSKVGSQWRFDRDEIDEWMRSQRPVGSNRKAERISKKGLTRGHGYNQWRR